MAEEKNGIQEAKKDKVNPAASHPTADTDIQMQQKSKFSLVELTMIIMLVGLVFVFWLPLRADKQRHAKVDIAVQNIRMIADENNKMRNEVGFYYDDLKQMDVYSKLDTLYFNYALTDSAVVVATSNKNFGAANAKILFRLPSGPFEVNNGDVSQKYIDPYWLP